MGQPLLARILDELKGGIPTDPGEIRDKVSTGMRHDMAVPVNQGTTNHSPVPLENEAEVLEFVPKVMIAVADQFVPEPHQRICPSVIGKICCIGISVWESKSADQPTEQAYVCSSKVLP